MGDRRSVSVGVTSGMEGVTGCAGWEAACPTLLPPSLILLSRIRKRVAYWSGGAPASSPLLWVWTRLSKVQAWLCRRWKLAGTVASLVLA